MSAAYCPGGCDGWRAGAPSNCSRALRALLACALLAAAGLAGPVAASVLYRCAAPDGVTAFVSHTRGYRNCVKIGAWATPHARATVARRKSGPKHLVRVDKVVPGSSPAVAKTVPATAEEAPEHVSDVGASRAPEHEVWQPWPVAVLNELAGKVLPQLLGAATSAGTAPLSDRSGRAVVQAATPIPLKLQADPPRPPRKGAVYRIVKKNGTVLYTNVAALATGSHATRLFTYIVACYACSVHSKVDWNTVPLHLADYRRDIHAAARLTGVNAALLRAVIHAESGFNPRALSYKGAEGLMQLMPATAFELGVGNAFDPAQNISGGARYLAALLRDYHGDVNLAAAAYNAGAQAVAKYGGVPPYAETRVYVKRVALLYQRYRKALAARAAPALAVAARAE